LDSQWVLTASRNMSLAQSKYFAYGISTIGTNPRCRAVRTGW
jgi:hypothetical protein